MIALAVETFALSVDVPLESPQSLQQAQIESFAQSLCDPTKGFGIRPAQCQLVNRDSLYQWEFQATLFDGNGTLVRVADRLRILIRNARTSQDWRVLHQALLRSFNLVTVHPGALSALSIQGQIRFPSPMEREKFLRPFAAGLNIARPGFLGSVRIPDWEHEVRVLIEDSNLIPNAISAGIDTPFSPQRDWDSFIESFPAVFENALNLLGLSVPVFPQA
jgi:hypothetical protein